MYYYDPDKNHSRRWAAVAAFCYALLVTLALLFVSFDLGLDQLRPGEGILIDFGTDDFGAGTQDLAATDVQAQPQRAAAQAAPRQQAEYVTSDRSDVEVVESRKTSSRREEASGETKRPSQMSQPAEEPRQVNRRALFPGRTQGSTSTSEGPGTQPGNAGHESGAPQGSHEGTGKGNSGIAYDLSGRSVVGRLPVPLYPGNESGKVVVDVTVDASGRVTYASYRAVGSTTNSKQLVDAAIEAAYKARFSESETLTQSGTITYVFTLK